MQSAATSQAEPRSYRMKDLCELTKLSRQTIHFYVQQGLLEPGHKTGRNMAYYTEAHLERLQLIQRLQRESFLPLKAIKAVLDGQIDQLEPSHRELLHNIKVHLPPSVVPDRSGHTLDAAELTEQHGVTLAEIREMGDLGLIALLEQDDGALRVPESDSWAIELFGQMRAAGLSAELGFSVADLRMYEQAVSAMFESERELLLGRMAQLPPEKVAAVVERSLPVVHAFVAHYHTALIRNLFAAME